MKYTENFGEVKEKFEENFRGRYTRNLYEIRG